MTHENNAADNTNPKGLFIEFGHFFVSQLRVIGHELLKLRFIWRLRFPTATTASDETRSCQRSEYEQ